MIGVIIIEDDELSANVLQGFVEKHDSTILIAVFSSAITALKRLPHLDYDLILLDVEMPRMSGMEFIEKVNGSQQIIIVSGKKEYAAEAYNFDVTDYLVKPVNFSRFEKAILKYQKNENAIKVVEEENHQIYIKTNKGYTSLPLSEIIYIEAYADYVKINTLNKKHVIHSTMKSIEKNLSPDKFFRVHRSYIIALDKITDIVDNTVEIDGVTLPVSRPRKRALMEKINSLKIS